VHQNPDEISVSHNLRGRENVLKLVLLQVGALNLSLVMRQVFGKGTPRGLHDLSSELVLSYLSLWCAILSPIGEKDALERILMVSAQVLPLSRCRITELLLPPTARCYHRPLPQLEPLRAPKAIAAAARRQMVLEDPKTTRQRDLDPGRVQGVRNL
jgi:hypothetical protein